MRGVIHSLSTSLSLSAPCSPSLGVLREKESSAQKEKTPASVYIYRFMSADLQYFSFADLLTSDSRIRRAKSINDVMVRKDRICA